MWKAITERICSKLHELEDASPPNPSQMRERNLKLGHADGRIGKQDPVLPEQRL